MIKRSGCLALVALCGLMAGNANAQCGGGFGGGYGYWDIGRLYQVLSDNVPYYSAFPPVYYSMPVPRTYGYSPFAYPPGVMTPEIVDVAGPAEIINPHIEPASLEGGPVAKDKVTQAARDSLVRTAALSGSNCPRLIAIILAGRSASRSPRLRWM
jgi:hypothetical protein